MEIPVKQLMSGDPVSVAPDAAASEALERMMDRGIRHLPVVDPDARVVGVLSIDDLRAALPVFSRGQGPLSESQRAASRELRVGDIMTHAPETLPEGASLSEAAERMADRRIGCLPIVEEDGRLAGMLSETDVLHALAASLWTDRVRERRGKSTELRILVEELRRERQRISERLDRLHAEERQLSADLHDEPMDRPEQAADLGAVRRAEALDALSARRLEALDRALDHAAQDRLGVCDACGQPIPLARLRALPGTTVCVACARAAEEAAEPEERFERIPGGRAETGRPELGSQVETRFGEGQLLRVVPYGSCERCGDVEGRFDAERDEDVCGNAHCERRLDGVNERAVVAIGEREVYVDPAELHPVDAEPYD